MVNSLFVVKYAARTMVPYPFAIVVYALLLLFWLSMMAYITGRPQITRISWYVASVVVVTGILIALVIKIDPYTISVDRWSALHNVLANVFDGHHPFTAKTHLGNQAAPFPMMYFIALPFYLLGDVGYLPIACFILVSLIVAKSSGIDAALWMNGLLIISPAFWYEGAVRSDLMSNFLLVALVMYVGMRRKRFSFAGNFMLAVVIGLMLCTRGVTALPLIVFYGYYLKRVNAQEGLMMVVLSGIAAILPFLPFALWDWKLFFALNPALLQADKTPWIVQIAAMAAVLYAAFKVKTESGVFNSAFFILFSLMAITFCLKLHKIGWDSAVRHSIFDLTYLSISLPFFLFCVVLHMESPRRFDK
jgi:hypothetical protein